MHILVTGGAGYLGNHLVPLLLERGHTVRVFDRLLFGADFAASLSSEKCGLVQGDIRRLEQHPALLDGIEAVIHLAGLANDPSCDLDPEMAMDVNFEGTKALAGLAIQHGVRRFVLSSSCSVYGQGMFDVLDEKSPTNPVSTYARSKLKSEAVLLERRSDTFEPVIARPATLFGWSPRMRFDLAINQMVATALRKNAIFIYGGGGQWRPFVHVKDAALAFALLVEAPSANVAGELFNVGTDDINYRVRELAKIVAAHFEGVKFEIEKGDEDLRSYRVQFDKIRRVLDFTCRHTVDEGIDEIRQALQDETIDPFSDQFFNVRWMKRLRAKPAVEGGEPVAPRFVPLAKPTLGPEEEQAVIETLRSGWLTTGSKVRDFEKAFAETVQSPCAVATTSCTAALHLALVDAGVKPGDEVITPPITWASTINTIVNMGAKPVFVDVNPDTLNLDPGAIEAAVTDRTRAIVPVHMAGQPCALDAIYKLADKLCVPVIEDAAHALGAQYHGKPIGSIGHFTCFSFYPIKNITTIEGGMIAVKREEQAERLRMLTNNGMPAAAWNRYAADGVPTPPEVVRPGFKYHMPDVHAAIGLEQLKRLDSMLEARRRLVRLYQTVLNDIDEITLPAVIDNVDHAWHLFIIRLKLDALSMSRDEVAHALRQENIGTGIHFYGVHLHEYYRKSLGIRPEDLPNATAVSQSALSLPLYPKLTDKNVRDVVDALKKVLAHAK